MSVYHFSGRRSFFFYSHSPFQMGDHCTSTLHWRFKSRFLISLRKRLFLNFAIHLLFINKYLLHLQRRLKLTSYVMKRISTAFLQTVIVLIGIVALIILIWFPLTEGRATHLDLFSTYADPFILYGYGASIAFLLRCTMLLGCSVILGKIKCFQQTL